MPCLYPTYVSIKRGRKDGLGPDPYYRSDALPLKVVAIPCHKCFECLKRRANDWLVRMHHHAMYGDYRQLLFVTITVRDECLPADYSRNSYSKIWTRFQDVVRKRYGWRFGYWLISEFGDSVHHTGRLHFHGFIWQPRGSSSLDYKSIHELLQRYFGYAWLEPMKSRSAISYCLKYAFKGAIEHEFSGLVIASSGIGREYVLRNKWHIHGPLSADTGARMLSFTQSGRSYHYAMPDYYRSLADRLLGIHKVAVYDPNQTRLIRYGPFQATSASDTDGELSRLQYIGYLRHLHLHYEDIAHHCSRVESRWRKLVTRLISKLSNEKARQFVDAGIFDTWCQRL